MESRENELFTIIYHAGNAKSLAMEAIECAELNNFTESDKKMSESKAECLLAHEGQTQLLFLDNAQNNEKIEINILLIHAMDHLSMANTVIDLAEKMISTRKEQACLLNRIVTIENKM